MDGFIGVITRHKNKAEEDLKTILSLKNIQEKYFSSYSNIKGNCAFGKWGTANQIQKIVTSNNGKLSVVFSGSIVNQEELSSLLEKEGVDCKGFSVEDILLNAYLIWGNEVPNYLNGAFVFAIWDEQNGTATLFRDRLGQKSLYYYVSEEEFCFSTHLKAIEPFVSQKDWSTIGIQYFFRFGYIPAPYTIYEKIKKLDEGAYLQLHFDTFFNSIDGLNLLRPVKYWKLEDKINKSTLSDENKAIEELHNLLKSSVEMHVKGEKSVGVLLSGGIDSSLMAAMAQSFLDKPLPTFSIGFNESSHNESKYARQIAKQLGTEHHEFILSYEDARELVAKIPDLYEQPYADSSSIPTYLVSRMAKSKVDKVILGDAGDELFMGYGMYTWANRLNVLSNFKFLFKTLLSLSPKINHKRASQYFDFTDKDHLPSHIFSVEQGFFTAKGIRKNFYFEDVAPIFQLDKTARKLHASEQQSLFDLKYYLPGDLTEKVNRATNALDLTATAPILDFRIVEWSLNLDKSLKRKGNLSKYILKEILYKYLPSSLFQRPKWGFGIPLGSWLSNELKPLLDEYVNEEQLNQYPFYNTSKILKIKEAFLEGKTYLYQQLWLVIMFNMWAENKK